MFLLAPTSRNPGGFQPVEHLFLSYISDVISLENLYAVIIMAHSIVVVETSFISIYERQSMSDRTPIVYQFEI